MDELHDHLLTVQFPIVEAQSADQFLAKAEELEKQGGKIVRIWALAVVRSEVAKYFP